MKNLLNGRMGRKKFIIGAAIWYVYYYGITMLFFYLGGWKLAFSSTLEKTDPNFYTILLLSSLVTLLAWVPLIILSVKRLHDFNASGYLAILFLLPWVYTNVLQLVAGTNYYDDFWLILYLGRYFGYILIGLLLFLALRKSNPADGPNRFGMPDTNKSFFNAVLNK